MEENFLIQKLARTVIDEFPSTHAKPFDTPDPLRPGQVVRQRSQHQLDPGDRERTLPPRDRVEHRGAPGARLRMKKAVEGRDARRRRSRKIWLTKLAKRHLQLRPGRTSGSSNAMMHTILEDSLQDDEFIREHTEDPDAVREVVSRYTPEEAERVTGVWPRTSAGRPAATPRSDTRGSSTPSESPSTPVRSTTSGRSRTSSS